MTKSTVTRVFVGSVVAVIAGIVAAFVAVWVGYANGAFVMDGQDVVGVQGSPGAWTMVGIALVAALAVVGGGIGALVSWIGALLNTAHLDDKTWFVILLVLGVLSFGVVAMVAYVIGGPDGTATSRTTPASVAA